MPATDLDQIVSLCKRRGFVYQSAEIYGGFRSTYDYGPLGSLLLRNVKEAWVRSMVQQRDDVVLIDAAILEPAAGVGGVRPPRQLLRSARRLHELQAAVAARQARRPEHVPELRRDEQLHRGPRVQPDVQDPGRAGRGHRRRRVPAPRDGAGDVHQLRAGAADHPQEAAVRDRPGRQELPQRDHAAELDLPHPRVRADGAGVLRAAGRERRVVRVLVPAPDELVRRARHPGRHAPAPAARRRRAVALFGRHVRRRVQVPVGLRRARRHRPAHRLRPEGALGPLG